MQSVPTGWAEARAGLYRMETKVSLAGVDYGESELFSVSTRGGLFSGNTVGIGGCVSREINLSVMPQGDIPRMAEIRPFVRPVADGGGGSYVEILTDHPISNGGYMENFPALGLVPGETYIVTYGGEEYECVAQAIEDGGYTFVLLQSDAFQLMEYPPELSATSGKYVELRGYAASDSISIKQVIETGWLRKGVFYIDTRDKDKVTGVLTIHGYDAMLKAEQPYLSEGDTGEWPRTERAVVADIAARMGVEIDSRTVLSDTHMVAYPGDYTMREILGHIAAAHGGNWIITDAGALYLAPLNGAADSVDIGNQAVSLDYAPAFDTVTGVRLWYDDEACYFAGDETGRVLEADCPWATQSVANEVLASVQGYVYQPFSASTAILPLEMELGDLVSVGGVTGPLASINTVFGGVCTSDISAPSDEEVDHEYPYQTKQQRELRRKVALNQSYFGTRITRANGLEVVKTAEDGTETARARLNSDVLVFYDAQGKEALYFDAATGKYRFVGDVAITGGTMNVNDKFIVEENGNLTLNGNINMSGGSVTWGKNGPEGYLESIGITEIDKDGVKAPRIEGAEILGGKFMEEDGASYIRMESSVDEDGTERAFLNHYADVFSTSSPLMQFGYVHIPGTGLAWALMVFGTPIIYISLNTGKITYAQTLT